MYSWQLQTPGTSAGSTEGQALPWCLNHDVKGCTDPGVTEKSNVQLAMKRTWSTFEPYSLENKIYLIMEDELWTRALRHRGGKAFTGLRAFNIGTGYSYLVVLAQGRILCYLCACLKRGMRFVKYIFRWEHVKTRPHIAEGSQGTPSQLCPLQRFVSGLRKARVQVGLWFQYSSTVTEPSTPAAVATDCNSFFVSLSFLLSISSIKRIVKRYTVWCVHWRGCSWRGMVR